MTYAVLQNRSGNFIQPDVVSSGGGERRVDGSAIPLLMLTDQPGNGSWPVTGATFVLMYKGATRRRDRPDDTAVFYWVYTGGQLLAEGLDYVPMRAQVARAVEVAWSEIRDTNNRRVWAAGR